MSYKTIRSAQQVAWPIVRDNLDRIRASREAVTKDSSTAAQARARVPWNHVVANETVWALAKSDLLASTEAADVIKAARTWLNDMGSEMIEFPEQFGKSDFALRDAVQTYVATLVADIDDNEDLHLSQV